MKKIAALLMSLLMIGNLCTLTSCSSDDDEDLTELTSEQIAQYSKDIVGKWKVDNSREYWRFDEQGAGSVGYGENWDEADEIYEGEDGTYKIQWYFKPSGLYIIIRNNGEYGNPDTDCPYTILSLTESALAWKSADNHQKRMTRVN